MRWLIVVLVVLLLMLQIRLWSADGGVPEVVHLHKAVAAQRAENQDLQERNEALEADVKDLKGGLDAVEERARSELGMIKDGERFYQVAAP